MNKISSILLKERWPFSLYLSCVTHRRNLPFSIRNVGSFTLCRKQKQQVPLSFERKMGIFNRIKVKVKSFVSENTKAKVGGCLAFEKIGDDINYNEFLQYFELPDTFHSWFLAMQLHVWMTISATVVHAKGKVFKISLVDSMWNDVELRMEELAVMKSSVKKKFLKELVTEFQAGLIAFDEGIFGDDTVLAAAAWRMLFDRRPVHPKLLENAVLYIRKQLAHIESQNTQEIVFRGSLSFLTLNCVFSDDEVQY